MWIYTFRFWLFQLVIGILANLYLARAENLWWALLNPVVWISSFISLPMWILCFTAGALSAFGSRIWLLMAVLQIFGNLFLMGDAAQRLETYAARQAESHLSERAR